MSEYETTRKPAAQHVDQKHASSAPPKSAGAAHAGEAKQTLPANQTPQYAAGYEAGYAVGQEVGKPAKSSLLSDDSREKLRILTVAAVGRAHSSYLSALGKLELDRKIEKEDELPLWASLLFTAGGKFAEVAFGLAVKSLRAAGAVQKELAKVRLEGVEHAEGLAHELREKSIEGIIGVSIDAGKEAMKAPVGKGIAGTTKEGSLDYIARLKDGSMFMFQALANKVVDLDDANLVAAFKAFSAEYIQPTSFEQILASKIERFMSTRIRSIGSRGANKDFRLERKVAWLFEPGQGKARLVYVDDAFSQQPGDPGPAYESIPKLSLDQDATWTKPQNNRPVGEQRAQVTGHAQRAGVKFVGYVEEEFVEVAVEQQSEVWLEPPRYYRHVLTDGAPRMEPL